MAEQREDRDSFPKKESTGEESNAGNSGEGNQQALEDGEGRSQEGMAGQGTGQIKGADGERETRR
jgi:hypothetical protein